MFEVILLQNLLNNREYVNNVIESIESNLFEDNSCGVIFDVIKKHAISYDDIPTIEAIAYDISKGNYNKRITDDVCDKLKQLSDNYEAPNQEWLIDETKQWMQNRSCFNALNSAIDLLDDGGNIESLPALFENALSKTIDDDDGLWYFEDSEEYFDMKEENVMKIPFSLDCLNYITNGGANRGCLHCVSAPINGGKTTILIWLANMYTMLGYNVLYVSAEISKEMMKERMDVSVLKKTFKTVEKYDKKEYLNKIERVQNRTDGRLVIKDYPAGTVTSLQVDMYIKRLKLKDNFVPDVVIVDYLGECASSVLPANQRGNTDVYLGNVTREFRASAKKNNMVYWSASQFNRDSQDTSSPKMKDNGESITMPKVLDFQLGFSTTDELEERNEAICTVMKTRLGAKFKPFRIGLNHDKQSVYDLEREPVEKNKNDEEHEPVQQTDTKKEVKSINNSRLDRLKSVLNKR